MYFIINNLLLISCTLNYNIITFLKFNFFVFAQLYFILLYYNVCVITDAVMLLLE